MYCISWKVIATVVHEYWGSAWPSRITIYFHWEVKVGPGCENSKRTLEMERVAHAAIPCTCETGSCIRMPSKIFWYRVKPIPCFIKFYVNKFSRFSAFFPTRVFVPTFSTIIYAIPRTPPGEISTNNRRGFNITPLLRS
jgi:hypothetical protein